MQTLLLPFAALVINPPDREPNTIPIPIKEMQYLASAAEPPDAASTQLTPHSPCSVMTAAVVLAHTPAMAKSVLSFRIRQNASAVSVNRANMEKVLFVYPNFSLYGSYCLENHKTEPINAKHRDIARKRSLIPIASNRMPKGVTAIVLPMLPRVIVNPTSRGYLSGVNAMAANISVPTKIPAVPSPVNKRDKPISRLLSANIKIKEPKEVIKSPIAQDLIGPILPHMEPQVLCVAAYTKKNRLDRNPSMAAPIPISFASTGRTTTAEILRTVPKQYERLNRANKISGDFIIILPHFVYCRGSGFGAPVNIFSYYIIFL